METITEKLHALLRQYPLLADGDHDKELIAKYLEVYHNHVIPLDILRRIPSFETIRRTRQYFTAEQEAAIGEAAEAEQQLEYENALRFLRELMEAKGYKMAAVPPMIAKVTGLEPTIYGEKGDNMAQIGFILRSSELVSNAATVSKLHDVLLWVRGSSTMESNPILVLIGESVLGVPAVVKELKQFGWEIRFG